ncbi:hypothetical protein HMPREF3204_00136 [Gardnerella pickettii]|nr:hypothetical protein HMPREF3204_00136 [Gardnerella pickettii]
MTCAAFVIFAHKTVVRLYRISVFFNTNALHNSALCSSNQRVEQQKAE